MIARFVYSLGLVVLSVAIEVGATQEVARRFVFDFASQPSPGATVVRGDDVYTDDRGWGYERGRGSAREAPAFSVKVREGNYAVTIVLGDAAHETNTTVKAEQRRLVLEAVKTGKGEIVRRKFVVNVRTPEIAGGGRVRLNQREVASLDWDDKLTLEFNGPRPGVREIEIRPASDVVTVYIAGDSTVTDQPAEPYVGWGQTLPRFFSERVAVSNQAESGRALYSFRGERRLEKILSTIRSGDYLLIQFGHNDQKNKAAGAGAFTTYKADLEQYIAAARAKGATPVVVTPMYRRRFNAAGQLENSLRDFPEAARRVAKAQNAFLIDLHQMSGEVFQTLGPEDSKKAFLYYRAGMFPGQEKAIADDSHFSAYGAYELARCVVECIRRGRLPLAKELAADVRPFGPGRPDDARDVEVPASSGRGGGKVRREM